MVSLQQLWKPETNDKEGHGRTSCQVWIYARLYRWIFHGEAHCMRDEVVRHRVDECDAAGGIGDMLDDYEDAHFGEGPQEEEPYIA